MPQTTNEVAIAHPDYPPLRRDATHVVREADAAGFACRDHENGCGPFAGLMPTIQLARLLTRHVCASGWDDQASSGTSTASRLGAVIR